MSFHALRTATASLALLAGLTVLAGCSEPQGVEARLRAMVAEAELAAEDRDAGDLMDFVHESYVGSDVGGSRGADRLDLRKGLHAYFIANQRVYVFTRVKEVRSLADDLARMEVAVALARQPIEGLEALPRTRADLFLLTLDLVEDGDWQVIAADWRDATPADFL